MMLPKFRFLLIPFVLFPLTSGCMPRIEQQEKDSISPEQIQSWDLLAEDYFVEDLACQDGEGLSAIGDVDVHQYGAGATQPRSHSFQEFTSTDSFNGPGFRQSIYNFHQQSKCKSENGSDNCESGSIIIKPAKSLKICRADANFARASIEGVALSSISSLDTAYRFYLSVPNARESLKDTTVIILPIVEKLTTEVAVNGKEQVYRSLMTDNLAYTSNFDGRPAFVVFPKSRSSVSKGRWKNLNLWELPWGMAHEFGHHVFRSHTGIEKLPGSIVNVHGLEFNTPIHSIDFDEKKDKVGLFLAERNIGPEDIFSAVNEGYADLFSYYALGQSSTLTEGVDCFEKNRDITSSDFANGTLKSLTPDATELFFGQERIKASSCDGPDFQDAHSIGAVIAHGIMRLYQARSAVSGANSGQQAGWLLAWADAIGQAIRIGGRQAVKLDQLIALGIKGVSESNGSLTAEQCTIIRDVFPVYADTWLSGQFTCAL